jgi:hypothetical protein
MTGQGGAELGLIAYGLCLTTLYPVHLHTGQVCNGALVQDQLFVEFLGFHNDASFFFI